MSRPTAERSQDFAEGDLLRFQISDFYSCVEHRLGNQAQSFRTASESDDSARLSANWLAILSLYAMSCCWVGFIIWLLRLSERLVRCGVAERVLGGERFGWS
jgi:hypothetical protein